MILETFFEKFDLFADLPGAVARMREIVLDLAVQGKLVAHDGRDEPASALLTSVQAERSKLIAARKIKARPSLPVESDECPFELPSAWMWARLSDVGYELGQKVPDKIFTYIDVGGIDSDKGRISDRVEKLNPIEAPSRARKVVRRGTVIYSTVRPYLRNVAIVDHDFDPEPIASTAFGILHPFEGITKRYLFYWLRSGPFTAYVEGVMKGMAYPAINDEKFYNGFIAIPPTAEQKRIVAKVDELMALCDRLEAQQQERETQHTSLARAALTRFAEAPTPAKLQFLFHESFAISPDDLRKSILALAVQGKLIPFDAAEDEVVGDHIDFQNGYAFKSEWFKPTGIRLCRNANVSHGLLDWRETAFVDDRDAKAFDRFKLSEGDIVLSLDRPLITTGLKVARVRKADLPCLLLQRVAKPVPKHELLDLSYFFLWLNSSEFVDSIDPGRSNGVPHISTRQVQRLPFLLPPLSEQRRIVAKVDELLALVDRLEANFAARTQGAALLDALVAELSSTDFPTTEALPVIANRVEHKTSDYFVLLIPAILDALNRPIELDRLLSTATLLFVPDQLLPLVESVGGAEAREHFASFAPVNDAGAFAAAIQTLARIGTLTHSEVDGTTFLHLNPAKLPPIDPVTQTDARHLASVIDLIPPTDVKPTLTKPEFRRAQEALRQPVLDFLRT